MSRSRGRLDDHDDDLDRSSPLLQTQRFSKSGAPGSKDFKMTQPRAKHNEASSFRLDLDRIHDKDADSLSDSDEDSNSKTGRSTSSVTTSQLTPKPKERSFLRNTTDKPKVQPRRPDVDDDDRNVFGQGTIKPSPRHHLSTMREDEQRDQSFADSFRNDKKRQSPTDMFNADRRADPRRNSRKSPTDHHESDDENFANRLTKTNNFQKSRHSPTDSDKSHSRRNSSKSKEESDPSDNDDHPYGNKQSKRQDYTKKRQSTHDLSPTSPKDTNANVHQRLSTSSRPGSASKPEVESARRSSYCEDKDTVIPPITNQKVPSRPTSAKANTTRQQTQSAIDDVIFANAPPALDPLTPNNEALAETLRPTTPPVPPPRPSARLPPKPKSAATTTIGGIHDKKFKYKVPTRYKEVTAQVDAGRKPIDEKDVRKSIDHAFKKALQSQTLPRPQSSRIRKQSANSTTNRTQRRRSVSAYDHIGPRVNSNSSINLDQLNTSQMRADSSQSIKDSIYLEWIKTKEEQKKLEKEELKRHKEETAKAVDKTLIERKVQQNVQNLARWREEKDKELKKKKQEERQLRREEQEKKIREQQQKKKDAKDGFADWSEKKKDESKQKIEEEQNKKTAIEQQQEEKRAKFLKSEERVAEWMNKKSKETKKVHTARKVVRDDQLKTLRQGEEKKFVDAQEAYEKWLKDKDKYELEEQIQTQRRNSLSGQQPQVPFLPGGGQKNTGKVRHVVW